MATHSSISCLENSKDRGAWWAKVCGVTKSRTCLSTHMPCQKMNGPRFCDFCDSFICICWCVWGSIFSIINFQSLIYFKCALFIVLFRLSVSILISCHFLSLDLRDLLKFLLLLMCFCFSHFKYNFSDLLIVVKISLFLLNLLSQNPTFLDNHNCNPCLNYRKNSGTFLVIYF